MASKKIRKNDNDQKKQTAIEYLCDIGHISQQEAEALINRLHRLGQESPPEPILSEFTAVSEVVSGFPPTKTILFFDLNLNIIQVRGKSLEEIGMLTSKVRGKNIGNVFKKELQESLTRLFQQALHGKEKEFTYTYRGRYYSVLACPTIRNQEVIGGIAIIRDITRETERKMQLNLLYKAMETTEEMVVITDAKEKIGEEEILYVNKGFESVTGYSREEVLGKNPSLLQGPDTDPEVIRRLVDNLSEGKRFEGETFNYRKDGSRFRLYWSIDPVTDQTGNITHFVSVQRDITEHWEQQQQLEQLIADREAMLKEIHHRIKNNLAVISGLLELQSLQTTSGEVREILTQTMNRIKSIAILHETLYKTDNFTEIGLNSYFREIAVRVTDSLINSTREISIETDIAPVSLSDIQAMPCGLILNEVITNSCKHAFPDQDKCIIRVQVNETESGSLRIRVSDNGCGLPEDFDPSEVNSLGMNLIDTLCEQLEAEYSFESSSRGTTFTMEFYPENTEGSRRK